MNLKNKKLIIFDFDGVLIDTLPVTFSLNEEMHENLSLEEYKSFFKGNIYDGAKRFDGTPKKFRSDYDEQYRERTRELKIPDKLKKLVRDLSIDYVLAIVSSTPTTSIKNILEREDVLSSFEDILGSDVHRSKIIKLNMLLEKYKIIPNDTIFITDTIGDVKEAKECGIRSIAVTWGFHDKETLSEANPLAIVDNPEDLTDVIRKILNIV